MARQIKLTKGKVAIVDDEDYEELSRYSWQAAKSYRVWYAQRSVRVDGRMLTIRMHCQLLKWYKGIDHRNGDGLDNRRKNLRRATQSKNMQNVRKRSGVTSRYLGVSWDRVNSKWVARARVAGKQANLGRFTEEIEAAAAYDRAVRKHHGPGARTNFP